MVKGLVALSLSRKQAETIATRYLRQSYATILVEGTVLEDDGKDWAVDVSVSSFDSKKKITVNVNAKTGTIRGWY